MPRVEITIVEAQGIPAADLNGYSDPFLEVCTSAERQKTAVVKKTLNPIWREVKTVQVSNPATDAIGFLVFDWDRVGANDLIAYGFISLIGLYPNGVPLDCWVDLFKKSKSAQKAEKKAAKANKGVPKPGVPGGRLHIVIRALDFQPPCPGVPPMMAAPPMMAPPGAYPPQPMPGQPYPPPGAYPPQPMPGQPYPPGAYPPQPMPGQPYPPGAYPPQPMPGQPMPGQPMMAPPPMMAAAAPAPGGPRPLVVPVPYKGAIPRGFKNKSGYLRPEKTNAEVAGKVAGKGAKKTLKVLGKILT